jgi:hypothetical protein
MMGSGDSAFHWQHWIGEALTLAGGLVVMAIVGVLSVASYLWSRLARQR